MTKNKSSVRNITEKEEIYRRIFENSAEGAILINEDGNIVEWNRFMEDKTNILKENAIGRRIWDVQYSLMTKDLKEKYQLHDLENIWLEFINTMDEDETISKEGYYRDKNGNMILTEDVLYKLRIKSKKYLYVIQRDMTQRRNLEQQLIDKEKILSHINATKDKIISIISHDLRNPLTTVLGFAQLMCDSIGSFNNEQLEEYIRHIDSSSRHTLRLLDNLLVWSKSQTGQLAINPRTFRLNTVVEEIIEGLESTALLKKIKLNYIPSDDIMVIADLDILRIVLRNLVHNAIKFTGSEGKIDVYALMDKEQLVVTVEDNGIGMDDDMISSLFEVGFNKSNPGTANETGSGLGLVLCRELVEKHHGKIWVESSPGQGSKFSFSLMA
jgi:PAS domain S-box-containing protein